MKAIIVDEGALRVGNAPAPQMQDGALRIRVVAAGINRADLMQRRGLYPPPPGASELLGLECAGEVIEVAAGVEGWRVGDRAMALLDRVGIAARASHRPAALSGGEQQRVAFCRALANEPSLLLADEPTGNLDPDTSARVFDALMGLVRDTGLAAVIATHNLELADRMDRQVRLNGGVLETL